MGKLFKGALLGAASALGAYYYKNPKEFEKHKELLKENVKEGLDKLNAIVSDKLNELEGAETDVAREKLEEVAANEEKVEDNFVSLAQEERTIPKTSAVPEGYEEVQEELVKEEAEEEYEEVEAPEENLAKEVAPVFEEATLEEEERLENILQVEEELPTVEEVVAEEEVAREEVAEAFGEVEKEETPLDNLEHLTDEELAALEAELAKEEAELGYEEEEVKVEEKKEEKSKTTLDSIVSLFASREEK